MKIGIVDYGLANLRSVVNAFEYLEQDTKVAKTGNELFDCDRLVLPGVGAFDKSMNEIRDRGHEEALNELIIEKKKPILGICLGMQLFCESSDEGVSKGLGWIKTKCRSFDINDKKIRVPNIGWGEVDINQNSTLFYGLAQKSDFYFVHSYFVPVEISEAGVITSNCYYGSNFAAALEWNNIYGCQFHPEKSQMAGLKLLDNFVGKLKHE